MAAADAGLTNSGEPHSETIAISNSFFTLFSLSYGGRIDCLLIGTATPEATAQNTDVTSFLDSFRPSLEQDMTSRLLDRLSAEQLHEIPSALVWRQKRDDDVP